MHATVVQQASNKNKIHTHLEYTLCNGGATTDDDEVRVVKPISDVAGDGDVTLVDSDAN